MTYRLTSLAMGELRSAMIDYERKEPGLGGRFAVDFEAAIARIIQAPEAWRPLSQRTRRCLLRRFPFGVLYQVRGGDVLIVSVMDLRRDPAVWRDHL